MTGQQDGDVLLFQTLDGGEISVNSGIVEFSTGLGTAVYISLFGGNINDNIRLNNTNSWWGNLLETEESKKLISETQYLLKGMAVNSSSLNKLSEVINRDLQWFLDQKIASTIDISVTIPAVNALNIKIKIVASGKEENFSYVINWKGSIIHGI